MEKWGWLEIAIVGGLWSIVLALIAVIWSMLNSKIVANDERVEGRLRDHEARIGLHYSEINNLKVDIAAMQENLKNQIDRFEELQKSVEQLRRELNEGFNRMLDKIDAAWRERRKSHE